MQIKLVQTEIEEAIRNLIQEQVTVKEGMDINIDLSATRGPEGFIANINIVRAGTALTDTTMGAQATPAAPAAAPAKTEAAVPAPAKVTKTPRVPKADAAVAASTQPAPAPVPEASEDSSGGEQASTVDTKVSEDTTAGTTADAAAAAPAAGKSLFGGLTRPVNS